MDRCFVTALAIILACGAALQAQNNPLSADAKADYARARDYFIRAAEKMPEANYEFKPAPDVRSFGQIVAHVADDQYNLCAPVLGETRKAACSEIENTLTTKTDLVPALKKALVYCDGAYETLTDASARTSSRFSRASGPSCPC
jgi:hypothetical protein